MRDHVARPAAGAVLVISALIGSPSIAAQPPAQPGTDRTWTVPRTPGGHPDLQGIWTNATLTPLERPRTLADRRYLTEAEAARLEEQAQKRRAAADAVVTPPDKDSYNQFWLDSGSKVMPTRQTSLVVDPPD